MLNSGFQSRRIHLLGGSKRFSSKFYTYTVFDIRASGSEILLAWSDVGEMIADAEIDFASYAKLVSDHLIDIALDVAFEGTVVLDIREFRR